MISVGGILAANLIGIGSNLDNCGTGIAYGSEKVRISHVANTIINGVGFLTAYLGAYLGAIISQYLTTKAASLIACVILVCIGLYFWYSRYLHPKLYPHSQMLNLQRPGWRQAILLGLALSFTNVASGFGATVSHGVNLWAAVVSITLWGYALIWLGNTVGIGLLAQFLGRYSSFFAGLLLIAVGLHQL